MGFDAILTTGRAPIDPNFVLAIERNQENQTNRAASNTAEETPQSNGESRTIIDEYKELALYEIFKGIVSKLISEDTETQE